MTGEFRASSGSAAEIAKLIAAATRVLAVSHGECGDGYGSAVAMARYLRSAGKEVKMFLPGRLPDYARELFPDEEFANDAAAVDWAWPDLIVMTDIGGLELSGDAARIEAILKDRSVPVVMIDHHASNRIGGAAAAYYDPSAAACALLVRRLLREWNAPLDAATASAVALGAYYDSNLFSNGGTTPEAFDVAAECAALGAPLERIVSLVGKTELYDTTLRVWGKSLRRAYVTPEEKIFTVAVLDDDKRGETPLYEGNLGGFANVIQGFVKYESGVLEAVEVLREKRGTMDRPSVAASVRTVFDSFDAAAYCARHGGGGHRKASGYIVPGKLGYSSGADGKFRWTVVN